MAAARKRAKPKRKSWWRRCVKSVRQSGSAIDPDAVCGALLRDKRAKGIDEAGRTRRADGRFKRKAKR